MEQYMDDYESYKRFTNVNAKCKCGCKRHCEHSCQDCEYCPDCECKECIKGQGYN